MLLADLADLLQCDLILGEDRLGDLDVATCFAADLMSDVLAYSDPGALLITGLTSVQAVHTAHIADLAAVLFVGGKRPGQDVVDLARENGIPLLGTTLTMYETCALLSRAGLTTGSKR